MSYKAISNLLKADPQLLERIIDDFTYINMHKPEHHYCTSCEKIYIYEKGDTTFGFRDRIFFAPCCICEKQYCDAHLVKCQCCSGYICEVCKNG